MSELVDITVEGGVADVRLNRPDKYNALSPEMFEAVIAAGEQVAATPGVRAVVLSGRGRGFCAGLDFASFKGMAGEDSQRRSPSGEGSNRNASAARRSGPANHAQRPAYLWKELPVPVIAALHGVAYGGGLQIALGADLRIAAPNVRLSVMEVRWGLVPDMSLTQTLRDIVRLDRAKELVFSGRVVEAEEAADLGLVTRVASDPLAQALELAHEIAGRSPDAIRAGKQLLEESWRADAATGLSLEARLQGGLIGSPNQVEAVEANFAERAPRFTDPA